MEATRIIDYFYEKKSEMIQALETLVNYESPSSNKSLVDLLGNHLRERFEHLANELDIFEQKTVGNQLKVVFDPREQRHKVSPNLVLCHIDTVWTEGTLQERPFRIFDGKAWGPGVLDMKGGIVLTEFALKAIRDLRLQLPHPIVLLFCTDEEIGSVFSKPIIEDIARHTNYAFIPESPLPGGVLKTARKGTARFVVSIKGRAAHSGIEPEKGISAVTELARQILYINQLSHMDEGTTVNIGVVQGGTTVNIVPPEALAEVDVRVWTQKEMDRITDAFYGLKPVAPGIKIQIEGGFTRPPMERSEQIASLFKKAKELGGLFGLDIQEAATGGASDGNFTAALGIPTLDGLGPVGEGAHAVHEHVELDSLPSRAALLTSLLLMP